jgi:putative tricarboxylic transport membrane protein
MRSTYAIAAALIDLTAGLAGTVQAAEFVPTHNVEFVIGAGAGGSIDTQGRLLAQAIERYKLIPTTLSVSNKSGAGSSQAISYLASHAGDGHYISLLASSWIGTAIQTNKPSTFTDVTPLVKLFDAPLTFAIAANSPLKTTKDLADALKKDPGSYRFAITTAAGNNNHLAVLHFAQLIGVDPTKVRVIVNESGATSVTQLLGGHIEVCVCTIAAMEPLVKAGQVRYLGTLRDDPVPGFTQIPTLKSQGYPVSVASAYTMVLPKGVSAEIVNYWSNVIKKAIDTPEIKKATQEQAVTMEFVSPADTAKFVTEERAAMTKRLVDFGFVKAK